MNFRRALLVSVASYVLTLGSGAVIMPLLGLPIDPQTELSPAVILISMILALVMTMLGAILYFRAPSVSAGARQGFWFGMVATAVAFVLDGLLFVLLLGAGYDPAHVLQAAYRHWFFGLMIVLGLAGTALTGHLIQRRDRRA